jgi:anti-anti-sigma factor
MVAVLASPSRERVVVRVEGPLHVPCIGHLTQRVRTLIGRGERHIVLDLAGVSSIDAAGIGELMHIHRLLMAREGALRVMNVVRRTRIPLQRVGVFDLLAEASDDAQ